MKYERKNSDNIAYLQAKIIIGRYCVVQDGGFLAKNYYFCEQIFRYEKGFNFYIGTILYYEYCCCAK